MKILTITITVILSTVVLGSCFLTGTMIGKLIQNHRKAKIYKDLEILVTSLMNALEVDEEEFKKSLEQKLNGSGEVIQ
jgi:hypothetical protein